MSPTLARTRPLPKPIADATFDHVSPVEAQRAERAIMMVLNRRDITREQALREIRKIVNGLKKVSLRNRRSSPPKNRNGERRK